MELSKPIIVKNRCSKCGHYEILSWKDHISLVFTSVMTIIGVFAVLLLLLGPRFAMNKMSLGVVDFAISTEFTKFAEEHDDELRSIALNLTSECQGDYPQCYAWSMYYSLRMLRYVPTSKYKLLYHPIYVYENGGDCRNLAAMFTSMMHSIGFDSEVVCSVEKNHCVSKVPLKRTSEDTYNRFIIVDLTRVNISDGFRFYNKTEDFWDK